MFFEADFGAVVVQILLPAEAKQLHKFVIIIKLINYNIIYTKKLTLNAARDTYIISTQ